MKDDISGDFWKHCELDRQTVIRMFATILTSHLRRLPVDCRAEIISLALDLNGADPSDLEIAIVRAGALCGSDRGGAVSGSVLNLSYVTQ